MKRVRLCRNSRRWAMWKWTFSDFGGLELVRQFADKVAPEFLRTKIHTCNRAQTVFKAAPKDNTRQIIHGGKTAQMGNSPPSSHWSRGIIILEIYISRPQKNRQWKYEKRSIFAILKISEILLMSQFDQFCWETLFLRQNKSGKH